MLVVGLSSHICVERFSEARRLSSSSRTPTLCCHFSRLIVVGSRLASNRGDRSTSSNNSTKSSSSSSGSISRSETPHEEHQHQQQNLTSEQPQQQQPALSGSGSVPGADPPQSVFIRGADRRVLQNLRVIQRTLVYAIGLSPNFAQASTLKQVRFSEGALFSEEQDFDRFVFSPFVFVMGCLCRIHPTLEAKRAHMLRRTTFEFLYSLVTTAQLYGSIMVEVASSNYHW